MEHQSRRLNLNKIGWTAHMRIVVNLALFKERDPFLSNAVLIPHVPDSGFQDLESYQHFRSTKNMRWSEMLAPKYRKISSFSPKKANGVYKQLISTSVNDFTLSFKCDRTVLFTVTYMLPMQSISVKILENEISYWLKFQSSKLRQDFTSKYAKFLLV